MPFNTFDTFEKFEHLNVKSVFAWSFTHDDFACVDTAPTEPDEPVEQTMEEYKETYQSHWSRRGFPE